MASDLRVGVIGVGMMGADHAERLVNRIAGARLVAVSDPDTARAEQLAAQFSDVRTVGDPLEMIADESVDAVVIASPGSCTRSRCSPASSTAPMPCARSR